jgi:hypothetical protein
LNTPPITAAINSTSFIIDPCMDASMSSFCRNISTSANFAKSKDSNSFAGDIVFIIKCGLLIFLAGIISYLALLACYAILEVTKTIRKLRNIK